ncbi:hypothetical protein K3G63_22390 [Hymenobacter sp. HSC-4F20]|uniref:hypothetical protein n=1 Tax=Hymenobacter sp. HSC-4F20 TaxID=2864135 RepID=UPI001C73636B|nr:hypothetical protein [Hymenobacter sp. HSC-4F20]MBX0293211.1 hypothetical protein [Hymenobacter sp. HSC-4F20]
MNNNWKRSIALAAWCCLSSSALAQLVPDSTQLQRRVVGQPFPFATGVALELGLYRRLQQHTELADLLLASKEERLRTLSSQLQLSQQLYAASAQRLREAEAASRRKDATIDSLGRAYDQAQRQARRRRWQLLTPATGLAAIAGLLVGACVGR